MKAGRCERRRSEHTERSEVCESFILIMGRLGFFRKWRLKEEQAGGVIRGSLDLKIELEVA